MKKRNVITNLALLLAIALAITACAPATSQPPITPAATAEPADWINFNIVGSVTADVPSEKKDDFYVAVNHDWLMNTTPKDGTGSYSAAHERNEQVQKEIETILQDTSLESHDAKLVQQLYHTYMDMDARNALGVQPLQGYVDKLKVIDTIDELSAYLVDNNQNTLVSVMVDVDIEDSSRYAVMIMNGWLTLQNPDEYREITAHGQRMKAALDSFHVKSLMRLGFTEAEAEAAWDAAFAFETALAQKTMGWSASYDPDYPRKIYNTRTIEELQKASPAFPLVKTLENKGFAQSEIIVLTDPAWLDRLNELYTQENLEAIKTSLLLTIVYTYADLLDAEFQGLKNEYNNTIEGSTGVEPLADRAYSMLNRLFGEAVGKLYVEQYFPNEIKTDVENIIAATKDVFRKRLEKNDWLGDKTKQMALEKLDHMRVNVGYPNSFTDYSTLNFKHTQDGGNLVTMVEEIERFHLALDRRKINTQVDKDRGDAIASPQQVDAFYEPYNNAINIPAGILGGVFYDQNATEEARMGGIGVVIGHEITHAFDTLGSQYDNDGNLRNWWTDQDAAAFRERTDRAAAYFDSIETLPGVNVNGELVVTEATADLGGVSCMLELAKGMPDFDYDDFFSSYVRIWREVITTEFAESTLTDPHAPCYLRSNAIVQQFPEFYDTYSITEGDAMYLAPEKRLAVW